jgi:beta-glucosidase
MHKYIVTGLAALLLLSCAPTPEQRARELVSKMSLEEKASLMTHTSAPVEALGIPAYNWWNEALHGVARNGKATVFPMPIAMAASFDEPLVNEVFTAVSDEARIKNRQAVASGHVGWYQGLTFWTPNINIFRDPRWGRGMETYGEDPFLTGQLGMAVVRGLQGPSKADVLKAHACAKHFAVHSGPEWSRHSYNAEVSERDLRETYLPAFKDLVTKADVQEVMIAYNRFRGEPCGASDYLINTILRGEWGYKGIVVSDCWAVSDFFEPGRHGFSPDAASAVAAAIHTGTDLECGNAYPHIPEAVERGLLDEADVDRSLERLLAARIRLGELDGNVEPWAHLKDEELEGEAHRELSRKMAEETLVLLQNRDDILPLDPSARIALLGPNADDREMLWGNYNPIPEKTVTLADAFKARIPDVPVIRACGLLGAEFVNKDQLERVEKMAQMTQEEIQKMIEGTGGSIQDFLDYVDNQKKMMAGFLPALNVPAVLQQLKDVDVVVFAGGISPRLEGEEMPVTLPGFKGGDRTDIQLPAVQRELLKALHEAGKKVVFVNFSGSAMGLEPETESCDAILQAWYPGEEGGTAIANVLFGDVAPSGKLPLTFYKSIDQLPDFEDYSMTGRTYRYFQGEPLYPFGFGLSYTTFEYGEARVKGKNLVIPISNTGSVDATEVVQLYVKKADDAEGPIKSLRGFQRVQIPAGQTVEVSLPLTDETFLAWSEEKQNMVPLKGKWELLYGGNSHDVKSLTYQY